MYDTSCNAILFTRFVPMYFSSKTSGTPLQTNTPSRVTCYSKSVPLGLSSESVLAIEKSATRIGHAGEDKREGKGESAEPSGTEGRGA